MGKAKHKPKNPLMNAIGFTEEDLEANRNGYMSQRQFAWLEREKRSRQRSFIATLVIWPLLSGLLGPGAILYYGPASELTLLAAYLGTALVILIFFIPFYDLRWRRVRQCRSAVENVHRTGGISWVEGWVNLDIEAHADDGGTIYTYAISLESMCFNIRKDVFLAFKNGDPYRIYYEPYTTRLLSAEWLRDET
jgi:hypothetical protein